MDPVQSTRVVPDVSEEVIQYVQERLKEKLQKNDQPTGTYQGHPYFVLGDQVTGYVVLTSHDKAEIYYFVRFMRVRLARMYIGRQILVWRNSQHMASAGFAMKVFFDLLLKKYGVLVSDKEQTKAGYRFWQYALKRAYEEGLEVFLLDRQRNPNSLTRLPTMEDLDKHESTIWGTTAGHLRTGVVISAKHLQPI